MTRRAHAGPTRHALLACALTLAACHGPAAAPRAPGSPDVAAPAPGTAPAAPAPASAAPAAPAPASATPSASSSPGATPAPPARLVVAVAELAGDPGHRVKKRVLAHLRALAPGAATGSTPGLRPDLALEVLDVPQHVLPDGVDGAAASDDSPFAILQQGHDRARALVVALRASALIWGTAGAAPVLYVTTADPADSLPSPCADPAAPADADSPRSALCALESGATWLLCATAWAEIVPVGCAPAP